MMNRRNFIKTLLLAVFGAVWGRGKVEAVSEGGYVVPEEYVHRLKEGLTRRKVMTFKREMVAGTPVDTQLTWGTGTIYTGVDFDNETCAVQVDRLVGYKRKYFDPRNWTQDMRDDCLIPPLRLDDYMQVDDDKATA